MTADEAASTRGRQSVEPALVQAAGEILAEVGPHAMSVRDVARRAGVNHGQVHHYFGSKEALSLAADEQYWKAVIRLVIEGELDIARIEVDEGTSVPRHALGVLTRRRGLDVPDLDAKTAVAVSAALQLGWVALEQFLFLIADVTPDEQEQVRSQTRRIATALFDANVPASSAGGAE